MVYDTAKNYNRVLYWDEENGLTKTMDTTLKWVDCLVEELYKNKKGKGKIYVDDGCYPPQLNKF